MQMILIMRVVQKYTTNQRNTNHTFGMYCSLALLFGGEQRFIEVCMKIYEEVSTA